MHLLCQRNCSCWCCPAHQSLFLYTSLTLWCSLKDNQCHPALAPEYVHLTGWETHRENQSTHLPPQPQIIWSSLLCGRCYRAMCTHQADTRRVFFPPQHNALMSSSLHVQNDLTIAATYTVTHMYLWSTHILITVTITVPVFYSQCRLNI